MNQYGIIAIHGGNKEIGTSEITERLAGKDIPYFINSEEKHITSTKFKSPLLDTMLENTQTIISIHGERNIEESYILVGGLDLNLRDKIKASLINKGFTINESTPGLEGISPNNVCNRGLYGKGVQLELSNRLRKELLDQKELMITFCDSIRLVL